MAIVEQKSFLFPYSSSWDKLRFVCELRDKYDRVQHCKTTDREHREDPWQVVGLLTSESVSKLSMTYSVPA